MYVCSQNTAKTVHDSANIFGPPYSPFSCGVQFQVSFKSGNEKIMKKSIPDSVKYSLGEFDQCKQLQRYSSLEISFFYPPPTNEVGGGYRNGFRPSVTFRFWGLTTNPLKIYLRNLVHISSKWWTGAFWYLEISPQKISVTFHGNKLGIKTSLRLTFVSRA